MKQLLSLIVEELFLQRVLLCGFVLEESVLVVTQERAFIFQEEGWQTSLSPHIKSLVIEDTHEKEMRAGPTHGADASLSAGDRILATTSISHLEYFPWRSVFLIKNEGCFQLGAKHQIVQYY